MITNKGTGNENCDSFFQNSVIECDKNVHKKIEPDFLLKFRHGDLIYILYTSRNKNNTVTDVSCMGEFFDVLNNETIFFKGEDGLYNYVYVRDIKEIRNANEAENCLYKLKSEITRSWR